MDQFEIQKPQYGKFGPKLGENQIKGFQGLPKSNGFKSQHLQQYGVCRQQRQHCLLARELYPNARQKPQLGQSSRWKHLQNPMERFAFSI